MMYLDLAIYFNSLPAETKIMILQITNVFLEILYFFWLRKYFKEEELKIKNSYY